MIYLGDVISLRFLLASPKYTKKAGRNPGPPSVGHKDGPQSASHPLFSQKLRLQLLTPP